MRYKEFRALLLKRFSIPKVHAVEKILRKFSTAEKALFYFLAGIFAFSGIILLAKVNNAFLVEVPIRGGSLVEGTVGNPRFINPVLALSEADKNLSSLIYSGLVRLTPEGKVENDLAEVSLSKSRLTYTARIYNSARFHDGMPVTADDVVFTISKIADPLIKSPKRGNWDGVAVEKIDDKTVTFTLREPYTPFIYNLNLGILPKHIWKNVTDDEFSFSQFNTLPMGSGPYQVLKVERNSGGIPNYYKLIAFKDGSAKVPYITNLIFKFYPSEETLLEAYASRHVDSISGISPEKLKNLKRQDSRIVTSSLPRVFAVFFNQSRSKALLAKEARQAFDLISPRKEIVSKILGGYGTATSLPLPAGIYNWPNAAEEKTFDERLSQAKEILAKAGWAPNKDTGILEKKSGSSIIKLSFSISTGDAPELQAVAETLAASWRQLGANIEILSYETGDLNQNVIRPRNFEALLFGEVVSRNADLYPFWHSSQRTDPGLNIALYANGRADKLLDSARSAENFETIEKNYKDFVAEIKKDIPAVFLYTPSFLYVVPENLREVNIKSLAVAQDRFLGVRDWYIETDKVWKIFDTNLTN
ncbi:MAG: peptide ABC transporter substrate-binding protein [Candidatus Zambryskibacteria bacterium]|nr:peptide ABC transporter substrate-binding protein [Candidatus Zambryskibacteria bacterium]